MNLIKINPPVILVEKTHVINGSVQFNMIHITFKNNGSQQYHTYTIPFYSITKQADLKTLLLYDPFIISMFLLYLHSQKNITGSRFIFVTKNYDGIL